MNFKEKLIKSKYSINGVILKIISQIALVFVNLLFGIIRCHLWTRQVEQIFHYIHTINLIHKPQCICPRNKEDNHLWIEVLPIFWLVITNIKAFFLSFSVKNNNKKKNMPIFKVIHPCQKFCWSPSDFQLFFFQQ